jgi:hypothetical protein
MDTIGTHRFGYIFDRLISHVIVPVGQLAFDVFKSSLGDADTAWLGQAFETRGNIDAIAIYPAPS